mgnify:CR=1 FL=1
MGDIPFSLAREDFITITANSEVIRFCQTLFCVQQESPNPFPLFCLLAFHRRHLLYDTLVSRIKKQLWTILKTFVPSTRPLFSFMTTGYLREKIGNYIVVTFYLAFHQQPESFFFFFFLFLHLNISDSRYYGQRDSPRVSAITS